MGRGRASGVLGIPVTAYEVIMKRRPHQLWWKYALTAIVAVSILSSVGACATAGVPPVGADDPAATRSDGATVTQENIMRSIWDGVYTEEQAGRGERAYTRACAACHLDDLLGDGFAPSLVGATFSFRWTDLSVGDIFATIRATMPQGAPASLSPQAYADLAAFLLSANDYPAGDAELEPDVATLEQIRIESQQP